MLSPFFTQLIGIKKIVSLKLHLCFVDHTQYFFTCLAEAGHLFYGDSGKPTSFIVIQENVIGFIGFQGNQHLQNKINTRLDLI